MNRRESFLVGFIGGAALAIIRNAGEALALAAVFAIALALWCVL
jgi:hypothetical protein